MEKVSNETIKNEAARIVKEKGRIRVSILCDVVAENLYPGRKWDSADKKRLSDLIKTILRSGKYQVKAEKFSPGITIYVYTGK
ncbi:hypothetical protein D3C78_19490 [compost metagenome]